MNIFAKSTALVFKIRAIDKMFLSQRIFFACDIVRFLIPLWNKRFPRDKHMERLVSATEMYLLGAITKKHLKEIEHVATSMITQGFIASNVSMLHMISAFTNLPKLVDYKTEPVMILLSVIDAISSQKSGNDIEQHIQMIYEQTKPIDMPVTIELQSIARSICESRNFDEYGVLLDNLEEHHGLVLPREMPLGLSHYVLSSLTKNA